MISRATFPEFELDALQLYANQAASAYDSAERLDRLENMRQAAEQLAGVDNLAHVMQQIVKCANEVLGGDSAEIWTYDSQQGQFVMETSAAAHIPNQIRSWFRSEHPHWDTIGHTILKKGWVGVESVPAAQHYDFMHKDNDQYLKRIGAQSFQGMALMVGNELLGVLFVNYGNKRSFSDEERSTAQTFANHAALVLKKAYLLNELTTLFQQVNQAQETAKVVSDVSTLENLDQTLRSATIGMKKVLNCDSVVLYVYDHDKDQIESQPITIGVDDPKTTCDFALDTAVSNILDHKEMIIAHDVSAHPILQNCAFAKTATMSSCVVQTLMVGAERVGMLFVNYGSYHEFTEYEITNIQLFANQASVAIRNAQLYRKLQKRASALHALHQAGQVVMSSLDSREILRRIAELAWRLIGDQSHRTNFVDIWLVENGKASLVEVYPPKERDQVNAALPNGILLKATSPQRIGIIGRTILEKTPQIVGDVRTNPDYLESHVTTHSELTVPIKINDEVVGVINVEHPEPNAFDEDDQNALNSVAAQASIALQNARDYEQIKHIKGLVGAKIAVEWMRMTNKAWAHTIGINAATINDIVELTHCDIDDQKPYHDIRERLKAISEVAKSMQSTPITAPLSTDEEVISVSINSVIQDSLKKWKYHKLMQDTEITLNLDHTNQSNVKINPNWFRKGFDIIIDNSFKAIEHSEKKQITIATSVQGECVDISIGDTGTGIPEEFREQILQEPIKKHKGNNGSGVGLLLAQAIVQTYGGHIRLDSTGSTGTTFAILLPIEPSITTLSFPCKTRDILLIGASELNRCWIQMIRDSLDASVSLAKDTEEASRQIAQYLYDLVMIDASAFDDGDDTSILKCITHLKEHWPETPLIVVSSSPDWREARKVLQAGASDYASKSTQPEQLRQTLINIMHDRKHFIRRGEG